LAYVETGVWQCNARRANSFAQRIGRATGSMLMHPVEANEVFARLGEERKAELRAAGFGFYDWGPARSGEARFVAAWDQREDDVESLCKALSG
jgi:threonine aldolase